MSSSRPWVPCFFPPLGISVLVSSKSDVKVYNAQTGVLEKEACLLTGSNVKDICMCVGYFTNERLVIAGGTEINARRHLNESILLQGFLNRRIQHKSDEISLELDSQQSSVLELFLFKNDYSLTDFEELTFETLNGRSPKWKTFTITGSYEHIYYLVNHLLHMCSHENHSVDPLYRSMLHRLIRIALDSDSILFYTAKREPLTMQCEAHRRLTFAHWPHMDYQWATPSALAEAGFYFPFKYPLDIVYCFECLINLASWEPTDEPWSEHIRHSSSCSFVSSPNLKSIPSVVSWATETAQTQTISNEPITVLTTTSSKDFIATSTVNGGITIWDLSYFNRRTLEFNLVDVLNASILDVSKRVNKSQLEVHCGCLLVSNAAYLPELICLPKPPKLHHLILACCLPNSVYNELKCTLNKNSSTTTTAATAVNSFGSHKLCLLILQLTPLNSEQLMWLSDTLSAPTSVKSFVYSSTISGANIFSLHSVPVNLMKFLPLIGTVGHTVEDDEEEDDDEEEEEAEEGGDDYDGVNGDGDDDDYDDELAEIDSNETESQNANLLVDDVTLSPPISSGEATMTQSPSTSQVDLNQPVEDGLYKYLALSNVIDESVSFKVMDCQKITSNDNNDASKLKSSSKPFFSSPSQSPSPSSPIKQQSNPTEATTITTTTDDILSDCHSKRITDKLPTLIGIIHLSDINNPTDTDVQKLNLKVLKISPVVGLPTSMNHANRSTTSSPQGILVCCGTELSSLSGDDDDDIHHNDTAENQHQSTENGDLFLFEYKAGAVDWNASHSVLSENPLLHIQLPGNYCPIEMDVLSNDNNDLQYCCCSNPLNNIIQLPIEYYSVKQDNQIKRDAKFTLQSFIDCTSGDLSMCCFLLTISGSLLQVNFYNDFSCLIQLLISDPISCIDEDIQQKNEKTDEETTSVNVHRIQFNAFTYCTGLGNLCLCTVDGQMCIYQLYNQELFKYDMNKEKRITLKSSASSVNIKKSKTSSSIIDNTSITSCSLSDLYAYCNSPIDQCIILHQLIQTIPVDAQIQINFPDRIGWYEVDLFRSIISPSPSDGRINNTRFEKKDMLTDDQDPKISSSSNDNETIHILSRLVTRYLQLEGCDSSNKSKLTTSTTNNLPVALKCASLAVQLSLSGGLSARLWEFNIKNWVAYQALMKHPSPERSANTMTDEQTTLPCKINSTAYSKMNTSSEYVLDISLPRVCSLSHFVFHSTMKPYEKTKKPPKVYITLLRKYISSNSSNFMHQSTSKINTDPSDLNNPPSDLDHSLVVEDLTAPYIDDLEYDCTVDKLSTSLKSKSEPVSNFDDEFLSKYLKVPGRFHQVPTQNLSSERLRELSANIIAGPYLLSDFLDVHGRYCCMPLTSSELIKCCSRLFALHIKIVLPETEVSSNSDSQSTLCEEESPVLSDLFAQIGLSVHQFQGHYKQPAYTSPTSDKNCSKQSVIDNTTPHSSTLSKIAIIPHERAQRLGILRSVKLHEACFEFLSSSSTEDVKKWSHLYKQAYPKSLFSIILDLMNWIVLMYYHELEFPCDVITNLLNLAGNSCENLIENLIVYGDRETTQLGTKFLFSLLKLEFIFLKYASPSTCSSMPNRKAVFFQKLCDCLSLPTSEDCRGNKLTRWLLICQTSGGCEALLNLLDSIISITSNENYNDAASVNSTSSLSILKNSLLNLFSIISMFGKDSAGSSQFWYRLPLCLGPVSLLNLPISNWTYSGSECLAQCLPGKLQKAEKNKTTHSLSHSTNANSNPNNSSLTVPVSSTQSIVNHNPNGENNIFTSLSGISIPNSYLSFLSGCSNFNDFVDISTDSATVLQKSTHSLFPLSNYPPELLIHLTDIISFMRYNFITNIDPSNNANNIILPDLQDWHLYGLLDVEPLHFPLDKLSLQLSDDCEVERVDFFTGELLVDSEQHCMTINESQMNPSEKHRLSDALSHLTDPVEAYHLVISRMHPGAHRSVTFSFNALNKKHNHLSSSSSVNLLTDIIIPVNPCLQCITLEALLDNPAGSQSSKKTLTKLIAVSTDIACSTLVLRDIHPPIEFTRLRISIVGRLDYPHGKARIHLGAYFGRAGLLMDCFNPIQFNADNRALNIFKCLDSLIMSRTTEFITVQQKLLNIWNQSDKKPIVTRNKDESEVPSSVLSDSSDLEMSLLYRKCCSLQYQINWLCRTSTRLRNGYYPESAYEYRNRICEMSDEQLKKDLYPDKIRYILERCLLCLLSHSNSLLSLVKPISPSPVLPPTESDNNQAFIQYVDECSTNILHDMLIHGSRSMQILIVGLMPVLTKINSLLSIASSTPNEHNFLCKFIREFNASTSLIKTKPQLSMIYESRRHLLYWAVIQRLIHFGMTGDLLNASVSILQNVWNSIDKAESNIFTDVLQLVDTIIENGCSSLLTLHKSFSSLLTSLDACQSAYCGQTGVNGLLKWHYSHQLHNVDRRNLVYPYCQTRTTRVTNGAYTYDAISHYQLCLISFYRLHLECLTRLSTQYVANRDSHFQSIKNDTFPLGALFVRRSIDSQTSILMRSCIPRGLHQTNTYPGKSLIPLETYQIPQQRFLCMFGDGDSVNNAFNQLLPLLAELAFKLLNSLLCVNRTFSGDSSLHENCFVICRLLGRVCWHLPGDTVRKHFIPGGKLTKSSVYSLFYKFCQFGQQESSLISDVFIECMCLILNCERLPDCPQTVKPDNYGTTQSIDLHKSKNKSWPYPNNSVVNYGIQQCMNSLWHLLPNHLVSTAQSVLFNPSDCYSCNSSDHSHVRGVGDNAAAAAVDDNRRRVKSSTNGHYALCELFSNCINTLLIKKSVSIHFCYPAHTCKDGVIDSHPCLLNILRLYCGIVGEPSFKPWKILSPSLNPEKSSSHQNNDLQISMHIKSVKYVLKSVKKLVLSVQKENNLNANSPFMKRAIELRRDVYTLTIQFLACVAADSSDLRLFILKSSEFSTFSTELFTDSSFAAEGINRSITSALEVLFTWFAYTKVEQSGCAIHPFDKFCLEQLTALIRDYALTSTLPFSLFDLDHDMTKGPRDLQAVLLTAICSRIKLCKPMKVEESEVNENTSLLRGIEDSIISCSSHTMSSMSFEYLLIIFKMISNYLYHRLRCLDHQFSTSSSSSSGGNIVSQRDVNNNNNTNNFEAYFLCLSSYSTVIDEEHEFYNKNSTLWSTMASNRIRQLGSSIIPDQLPENPASLATLYMNRLTCYCCYLPGICSAGNAYSQILSTSLYHDKCLSIILGNLCKILIENSTSTDRQKLLTYFTKHTELFLASLRVSHVPASLSTMITLSCLINGWKTLRRLTELIIRHFKAYSICDWVFYCVLTITTYSSSSTSTNTTAENSMHTTRIVKHLIHSLLSTYPLNSCCLFLLLSLFISTDTSTSILCNKDYADIILQTFVDDTQCLAVMIENQIIAFPSSSPYFKLSLEYTNKRRNSINSSELGQALLNQSLCFNIPCYQQSSALNFQCLNQSLPIGLSGPIHAFKQSSIKCLQDIIDLNYPSRKDKQTSHTITNTTAASCQCPSVNKTLVGKSELKALATICRRKDLLDFAPTALIYSDILDEQMASFCRTLSVIDDYNVGDCENNIIYPMYLGYSAYKSAPMTCTESGVIEEEDDLKNSNTTATTSTTHDNANKSSNDSNTNNVDLSSKLLVEKFSLSELTRTSFIFQNDNECLQIVVRLPCLIQLECVYLSTKNSAISASPAAVEVELYRDLPGASRRSFVSSHKSGTFPSASNSSSSSSTRQNTHTTSPEFHTIIFSPRLVSHVLLRLYRPFDRDKNLHVDNLRLLGQHTDVKQCCKEIRISNPDSYAATGTERTSTKYSDIKMRAIILLHLIHNELISQTSLPSNEFYSSQFVELLLQSLETVSMNEQLSFYTRQFLQMVSCRQQISEITSYINNLTSESMQSEWFYPLEAYNASTSSSSAFSSSMPYSWDSYPSSAVMCERILLGLLINTTSHNCNDFAGYLILRLLDHFPDAMQEYDQIESFISESELEQVSTDYEDFNSLYLFGPLASLASTPYQRLFAWLCLHQDAEQSKRIEFVFDWLNYLYKIFIPRQPPSILYSRLFTHWSQLLLIFSSVLWSLHNSNASSSGSQTNCTHSWRKCLTVDLISSLHDLCISLRHHREKYVHITKLDDNCIVEIEHFCDALTSLLCSLCSIEPNAVPILLSKLLVVSTSSSSATAASPSITVDQNQESLLFNSQLKILNSILSSDPIVYSVLCMNSESPTTPPTTTTTTVSDNFFYDCCIWLVNYLSSYNAFSPNTSSSLSSSVHSAVRRLDMLTYFMQSNQPTVLRSALGKLICDHLLPVIFSTFTSMSSSSSSSSSCPSMRLNSSNIYEFCQLQKATIELYEAMKLPIPVQKSPSDDLSNVYCEKTTLEASDVYVNRSNDLLIGAFKESLSNSNFELPNFLSELIFQRTPKPIVFKQTIAVFAVTSSNDSNTPIDLPWPLTGPPIVLNINASELSDSSLKSFLYTEIRQSIHQTTPSNYSIHPSLTTAILLININQPIVIPSAAAAATDANNYNDIPFRKDLCLKHLRLILYYLLHPYSPILQQSISRPMKLANSPGIHTTNDFELSLAYCLPKNIASSKDWNKALFLPEGYSDYWSTEKLYRLVNFSLVVNESHLLCLLVRPCEHARFLSHPPIVKQDMKSYTLIENKKTKKKDNFLSSELFVHDYQSYTRIFLKSGLLHSIAQSIVNRLLNTPNRLRGETADHLTGFSSKQQLRKATKQFNACIMSSLDCINTWSLLDDCDIDNIINSNTNNKSCVMSSLPMHCIIAYIILLRLTHYDLTLLNMIESRGCHVISTIANQPGLMYLPNYLIQLAANPNCCPTSSSLCDSSHSNRDSSSILGNNSENSTYSKILPLHCLCHFYENVSNDVGEVSVYASLTLPGLRWEHLNSGVLQLLLSYMCVLSRGSCSYLPDAFDTVELNAYLCANQPNCVNNHQHLLSSTIETINCLYTNLIKPACLNFESELFPSTSLSCQQTVSSMNSKTNKYQWDNFPSSIATSTSHKPVIITAWAKGTGFTTNTPTAATTILPTIVGDGDSTSAPNNSYSKMTQSKVEREDQYAIVLCNTLSGFLNTFMNSRSNHDGDNDNDDELFGSIVSYFMMKFNLINFIINYLRNNSIVEIVSRISLYRSIFRLIHSIALCPQLHWLLIFVQGDLDNRLIVEYSSKLFNAFQSYWSDDTTNASIIVNTITDNHDNNNEDDLNKCFSNIDSSCVIALSKQILSYLSKYMEHLNKLGLNKSVGSDYLSGEQSTLKTPKTEVIAQPANKPSKGLTRQPSIRYRTGLKKTSGNFTKTPNNNTNSLLTGSVLSNSEFDDDTSNLESSFNNHHHQTIIKTCSLLQLKSGFFDLLDETSDESGDGTLSTVTETDEKHNEEGNGVLKQSVEELSDNIGVGDNNNNNGRSQTIEPVQVNGSNESNNDLPNGSSHCEQLNNNNELNNKSSSIVYNKSSNSIYVNQHLLITLNELKNTFKILKIILMYQQLSVVNKDFDHDVNSSEDQSSTDGQTRSGSGIPNSQVVPISSSTSSTNQDYCLALKSIQFCMMKFLSVSEKNTVSLLVPHAYADLCTKHEGLVLLNRNIKKSPDSGDTSSTSAVVPSVPASAALSSSDLKKPSSSSKLQVTPKNRSLDCLQRLAQEVVTLSTSLPLSENASVFMRCDENHLCLIKAIITGPPDTPYSGGCFEFDIYIPPSYPSQPPLVEFRTTAKNTFRFNPNLYEDGKVCLSILNTWHGSAEERWNPETSSLLQVLVSIQSLIFVHEPYFNEPGFECTMGTPKGIAISYKYNARIRAATVRWAMINQLKHLPVGFEEVILKHFLHRRPFIISQVEQWILEMHNHEQFKGIEVYVKELEDSLTILKIEFQQLEGRLINWEEKKKSLTQ